MANPPGPRGLIIGIDNYSEGDQERLDINNKPVVYENLKGCVDDALRVEQYLLSLGAVEKTRIIKLLAPLPGRNLSAEGSCVPWQKPTYKAIRQALQTILDEANPGDMVYIHYSGHGARATTIFPEIKGEDVWDEALVPSDIRNGGCYLRDLELGLMLHKMVEKGLHVTAVLDCCHSGGGVRGGRRGSARAADGYYRSVLPADLPDSASEIFKKKQVMLEEPSGFSLMAACQPHERAEEVQLPNGRWCGIFTYSLMTTLMHGLSSVPSPRALFDCVCAMVRDEFQTQTPRFLGETNRFFNAQDAATRLPAVTISRFLGGSEFGDEVELSGGFAHGLVVGSEYAVIPFGATEPSQDPMTLLIEKVTSIDSVASIRTVNNESKGQVRPGCQAVLLRLPYDTSCLVGISAECAVNRDSFVREWEENGGDDGNWLQLARGEMEKPLTFQIALDGQGYYQILDRHGAPWPNITPPLPAIQHRSPLALQALLSRLRHLSRFLAVKKISNTDLESKLRGRITFEVSRHQPEGNHSQPLKSLGGEHVVKHGEKIDLRVKNLSDEPVAFVVFNLQPLYGITQLYPRKGDFETLDPNQEWHIRAIRMVVPPDLLRSPTSPSLDMLKLFVTSRGESFHCLGLPSIIKSSRAATPASDRMAQLLDRMGSARDAYRDVDIGDWQVAEIRVRTEV